MLALVSADDPLKDKLKSSKSKLTYHCDEITMLNRENRIQCRGHAVVKRDDLTIKCDILEVITDDKHNPKRVLCMENVFMKTADGESKSEKAEYDAEKEVVTLSGNPKLKRGDSEIAGETIIYDIKNERLRVKQGKGTVAPEQKK